METLKKYWFLIGVCVAILTFGAWLLTIQANASDAKRKAEKFEKTFENIEKIAQRITSPEYELASYLILHNVDTATAYLWSEYPRDPVRVQRLDSTGQIKTMYFTKMPFLSKPALPEVGVLMMLTGDDSLKLIIIDTLWNFWPQESD